MLVGNHPSPYTWMSCFSWHPQLIEWKIWKGQWYKSTAHFIRILSFGISERQLTKAVSYFQLLCRKSSKHKAQQQHQQQQQQHQRCCGTITHAHGCDLEGLSEKYWGEILERTLSSTSLHALQRAYSHPRMERCNGLQEMKMFDTSVPDLWKKDKTTQTFDAILEYKEGIRESSLSKWFCLVFSDRTSL